MLKTHINSVENHLLAISKIPANAGHTLHKGTPRETFIREFLQDHLSERAAISSGEIIDAQSKPNEARNQFDIVIYKRDYPKLHFGAGINGFLAESVVATIEVKSILDKDGMRQSIAAAHNAKKLQRHLTTSFFTGYQPPGILNYVIAYDSSAKIETVYKWIAEIHTEKGIASPQLSIEDEKRTQELSPSIDAVIVLGKGFIYFDNVPLSFINQQMREQFPHNHWVVNNSQDGNLLLLFLFLTQALSGVSASWLNPIPYLASYQSQVSFEP